MTVKEAADIAIIAGLSAFTAVIPFVAKALIAKLSADTKASTVKTEAEHRAVLDTALTTIVKRARRQAKPITVPEAIETLHDRIPDAMKALNPEPSLIRDKLDNISADLARGAAQ